MTDEQVRAIEDSLSALSTNMFRCQQNHARAAALCVWAEKAPRCDHCGLPATHVLGTPRVLHMCDDVVNDWMQRKDGYVEKPIELAQAKMARAFRKLLNLG